VCTAKYSLRRFPPMALSQSVASELIEAFRAGEGVDLIRESVRLVMPELIETEASERIGAGRYERTEARVTDRNGSRPRLVATQAGDVELDPEAAEGLVLPGDLGAAAADRPGLICGGDGGLRERGLHQGG
jgi:putative transposase